MWKLPIIFQVNFTHYILMPSVTFFAIQPYWWINHGPQAAFDRKNVKGTENTDRQPRNNSKFRLHMNNISHVALFSKMLLPAVITLSVIWLVHFIFSNRCTDCVNGDKDNDCYKTCLLWLGWESNTIKHIERHRLQSFAENFWCRKWFLLPNPGLCLPLVGFKADKNYDNWTIFISLVTSSSSLEWKSFKMTQCELYGSCIRRTRLEECFGWGHSTSTPCLLATITLSTTCSTILMCRVALTPRLLLSWRRKGSWRRTRSPRYFC